MSATREDNPAVILEARLAFLAVGLVSLLMFLDWAIWQPGLSFSNEINPLEELQAWIQGRPPALRMGGSDIIRILQRIAAFIPGIGLGALHLPTQALFLLESWFLWILAKKLFNPRAAAWALLTGSLCAFTWLRLRSDLVYAVLPAELLGLLAWNLTLQSPWAAGLAGMAAGFFWLDYEGWAFAIPILCLSWLAAARPKKLFAAWALGLGVGLGLVLAANLPFLSEYLAHRKALTLPQGPSSFWSIGVEHARAFVFGGPCLPNFGLENHPLFPVWAWPGLLAGAWLAVREKPWLLAGAVIGLAPLALKSNALEPNRLVAAWPLLCLLAGWGMGALISSAERKILPNAGLLALAITLGLTLAYEVPAFDLSARRTDAYLYGYSRGLINIAAKIDLDFAGREKTLLADLDTNACLSLRYLARLNPNQGSQGSPVALIPWHMAKDLDPSWGRFFLIPTAGDMAPQYLLYPQGAAAARLARIDQVLRGMHEKCQSRPVDRQMAVWRLGVEDSKADPWVRTICWENLIDLEAGRGLDWSQDLAGAEKEKLESVSLLKKAAFRLQDTRPKESLRLITRATEQDPRSRMAWDFRLDLLTRLGRPQEALLLARRLEKERLPFTRRNPPL